MFNPSSSVLLFFSFFCSFYLSALLPHNGLVVIEAASENGSTENADKRDYDKAPIQSMTETRSCQLKVPSESESPPFGTEEASQSTRVTRQTRRLEKDKDLEESLPLEGGKRKLPP
ncbi:hypothetical protein TWF506_009420 [Arthrobotrys conoides]|uniref:Uncharacterized protein n=1 Tax=Arthrobotrys conoides TaxID=74498 RepID=A0AAN8N571_9PEZI